MFQMRMKSKIDWNNVILFTKNSTKPMKEKRIYMAVYWASNPN